MSTTPTLSSPGLNFKERQLVVCERVNQNTLWRGLHKRCCRRHRKQCFNSVRDLLTNITKVLTEKRQKGFPNELRSTQKKMHLECSAGGVAFAVSACSIWGREETRLIFHFSTSVHLDNSSGSRRSLTMAF